LKIPILLLLAFMAACGPEGLPAGQKKPIYQAAATPRPADAVPGPTQALFHLNSTDTRLSATVTEAFFSEADYVALGQHAEGRIVLQSVPLVSQPDYTACGEAAFAMGWNDRHPELVLDVSTLEAMGMKMGVYFPAHGAKPKGYLGTSPAGMQAIGDYYAERYGVAPPTVGTVDLANGGAYAQLEAKGLLFRQLEAGTPVIIEVTDNVGHPSKSYNDSHYVIVTGIDFTAGLVIYNDPLTSLSMSGKYTGYARSALWGDVWASWSGNNDIDPGLGGHPGRGWYMVVH